MSLELFHTFAQGEAGTDEAGRGCLAGPVTAAAVILPENFALPKLNDSKKLTAKVRYELRPQIESEALSFAVVHIAPETIDRINILNASIQAMQEAVAALKIKPNHIIVDGNRFKPFSNIPYSCIVKGDGKFLSIAAASILAKTYRDDYMEALHENYPMYGWQKNKGYPTADHRAALSRYGMTPHHRMSFRLLPEQLRLAL